MATQFTAAVKKGGSVGTDCDYLTLASAETGLQNDLTAATSMVFSISANTTPTLVAGDAVTGNTSGATGTCVLVNYGKTQVWIKAISGTFQSGETVKKTSDAGVTVTLSNAGDTVICGIRCRAGTADTTAAAFSGWTTGASNYIRIYSDESDAMATTIYTTSGYRLEVTGTCLDIREEYVRVERISIKFTSPASPNAISAVLLLAGATSDIRLTGCYIKGVMHASNTSVVNGVFCSGSQAQKIINCIFDGFTNVGNTANAGYTQDINSGASRVYCCLAINCATGYKSLDASVFLKNCAYDGGTSGNQVGFQGTPHSTSNYNASTDATAPGVNSRQSQTFTYVGAGDYAFATTDTGAVDFGTDLSADGFPVTTDFNGTTRDGTWDIGPVNVTAVNPYSPPILPFVTIQFKPVVS